MAGRTKYTSIPPGPDEFFVCDTCGFSSQDGNAFRQHCFLSSHKSKGLINIKTGQVIRAPGAVAKRRYVRVGEDDSPKVPATTQQPKTNAQTASPAGEFEPLVSAKFTGVNITLDPSLLQMYQLVRGAMAAQGKELEENLGQFITKTCLMFVSEHFDDFGLWGYFMPKMAMPPAYRAATEKYMEEYQAQAGSNGNGQEEEENIPTEELVPTSMETRFSKLEEGQAHLEVSLSQIISLLSKTKGGNRAN